MPTETDRLTALREEMVASQLRCRDIRDERVLAAMQRVPRHQFVPECYRDQAYEDHPIPIGEDQTVSQPYIVAVTLEALTLQPTDIVLEVGTGSGYQAAILSELAQHVYSVERHESLAQAAQSILTRLGRSNITVVVGDGSRGLAQFAPYDAIVVAAAAPQVPSSLLDQMNEGGRMVIPVGAVHAQELQLVHKRAGKTTVEVLEACRFVPLIGSEGYND